MELAISQASAEALLDRHIQAAIDKARILRAELAVSVFHARAVGSVLRSLLRLRVQRRGPQVGAVPLSALVVPAVARELAGRGRAPYLLAAEGCMTSVGPAVLTVDGEGRGRAARGFPAPMARTYREQPADRVFRPRGVAARQDAGRRVLDRPFTPVVLAVVLGGVALLSAFVVLADPILGAMRTIEWTGGTHGLGTLGGVDANLSCYVRSQRRICR